MSIDSYHLAAPRYSRYCRLLLSARPELLARLLNSMRTPVDASTFPEIFNTYVQDDASDASTGAALRRMRGWLLATLIERDLQNHADLAEVVETMTAFAEFAIKIALGEAMREAVARHGAPIGQTSGKNVALLVLGMGKLGGGELNVSSDIDLIFVYPEEGETQAVASGQRSLSNHEFFTRVGKKLIACLADITEYGFVFRVDMALRPNGKSGPLVMSFDSLQNYFITQGREWERYAWIKARTIPTADNREFQTALQAIVQPFVFRRYLDFGAIEAIRGMHAQIRHEVVRQEIAYPQRQANVKLGRGGIREIEFLAQVFQLIRGGRDPSLQDKSTRTILHLVSAKNLLAPEVTQKLYAAYEFLRRLEHRLQYRDDAQTHILPTDSEEQQALAEMMGFSSSAELHAALQLHCGFVAHQFDAIFNQPHHQEQPPVHLNNALQAGDAIVAVIEYLIQQDWPRAQAPLAAEALMICWRSNRIQQLAENHRAKFNALIARALPFLAKEAEPVTALKRLLDFLEAIVRRAAYLALLTEFPRALQHVIQIMAASAWAAQYLTQHPLLLDELLDTRTLWAAPDWRQFTAGLEQQLTHASVNGQIDIELQMDILREAHHAQRFRLLAQDLAGALSVERLADHLSALADCLIAVTLQTVWETIPERHVAQPNFAVIAYGKLGGKELGYSSDLDIIFVYDDADPEAPPLYAKLAQRVVSWMSTHTAAGTLFEIDLALRPDGESGLLVSSMAAFEKYQLHAAWRWEHQALTRARFCAGDALLGARFEELRQRILCQARDAEKLAQDILAMREKMRLKVRTPARKNGLFDIKNHRGGMIDIEFIVQYIVLRYAAKYPQLTANLGNIALLKQAAELKLIDPELAQQAANAYRIFRKYQHQARLEDLSYTLIDEAVIAPQIAAVRSLWKKVFED